MQVRSLASYKTNFDPQLSTCWWNAWKTQDNGWCVWAVEFAIWQGTIRFRFSLGIGLFVILLIKTLKAKYVKAKDVYKDKEYKNSWKIIWAKRTYKQYPFPSKVNLRFLIIFKFINGQYKKGICIWLIILILNWWYHSLGSHDHPYLYHLSISSGKK